MKPANKKTPASKGFGFADAMFGIKDIAMDYENLQGGPIQSLPKVESKNNPKVQLIKKQPIPAPKAVKVQKKVEMAPEKKKQTFVISAGKQFDSFTSVDLLPIETSENVFELTIDGQQTNWQYNVFCDGIQANMIVQKPQVSFNFDITDVRQGGLGNCYFIATLASLAHLPKVLRQRIPKFKSYEAKTKSFQVNLFESGKNIKMLVDNLFPKIFTKPVLNDISLMILEKAYAQAYGNFQITNMGHSCDSLRDMTGAPTEYIDLKNKAQLIQGIKKVFSQKYPIVIASKVNVKMPFLSPKHSFNIIDYQIQGNNFYIKLRDPRGINCSQFPLCVPISQEDSYNGMFWIDYKNLTQNFEVITICKVKQGYKYFYKTFKSKEVPNNQACMMIKVKEPANFVFTCHQKHKKFFDDKFNYRVVKILVAKIDTKTGKIKPVKVIGSDFRAKQVCSVQAGLDAGQYVIFSQVGQNNTKPKLENEVLTISIYTSAARPESLEFSCLKGNISVRQFLPLYIEAHLNEFKESVSDKNLYRYFGPLYGYMCIWYQNKTNKSVIQQLEYESENITVTENKVSLAPNERKLLMHPIGESNNCSHKFAFKTKTFYK